MINFFIFKRYLINYIFKWKQLETKSAKNQQLIYGVNIETVYQLINILSNQ